MRSTPRHRLPRPRGCRCRRPGRCQHRTNSFNIWKRNNPGAPREAQRSKRITVYTTSTPTHESWVPIGEPRNKFKRLGEPPQAWLALLRCLGNVPHYHLSHRTARLCHPQKVERQPTHARNQCAGPTIEFRGKRFYSALLLLEIHQNPLR